jgi:hypothetical protein
MKAWIEAAAVSSDRRRQDWSYFVKIRDGYKVWLENRTGG